MNPSPNRQAVIVGLFVAVGVTILAGGILTIGDLNDTFTHKVTATALFDEVSGLQQGDNVWYSGVKVGVVKRLAFQEGSQVQVDMRIDEEAARFIHGDALAKIGSEGLIGSKLVVLYGGSAAAPTLQDGAVLGVGEAVSTEDLMATFQENNKNLLAITTDLKSISAGLAAGDGSFGKLLKDDQLYARALATVSTLETTVGNAQTLTSSLSTFAGKLNREGGLPNDLVTDRTTYASLTATVGELQRTAQHASDLVEGLALGAGNPNTPIGTVMRDAEAGADLKATLDNLHLGSELMVEDLEAAQHNFLLRGYFRKKARAKAEADAQVDERTPDGSAGSAP